jgi:hypothetical protein
MPAGAKPGERRGGRKEGTLNKRTQHYRSALQAIEETGCDPLKGLALIAMNKRNPVEVRARCFSELAQYLYPKVRAVEGVSLQVQTSVSDLSDEQLAAKIQALREQLVCHEKQDVNLGSASLRRPSSSG